MAHDGSADELALLARGHELVPAGFGRHVSRASSVWSSTTRRASRPRLQAAGVGIVQPLRDAPFGQRHSYGAYPNGVLLDVIELIPPAPHWSAEGG